MSQSLDAYLAALKSALAGSDRALVQDSLYDARRHVDRELARLAWEEPLLGPEEALVKALAGLGEPEQAAEAYRRRETLVAEALAPVSDSEGGERPWPTVFGIFANPKAYTSLLYLLLSLPVGIFAFTWVVTGLSLSLGLLVLLVGLPLLVFFLGSFRALGLAEGRLVEALLDVRMPRRPPLLPGGRRWTERLGNLFKDGFTWTSLLYLLLRMPLGILYFTIGVTAFSLSFAFLAMPLARIPAALDGELCVFGQVYGPGCPPPMWMLLGLSCLGCLGLTASLHLALALGRLQGWLARMLLVKR